MYTAKCKINFVIIYDCCNRQIFDISFSPVKLQKASKVMKKPKIPLSTYEFNVYRLLSQLLDVPYFNFILFLRNR